MPHQQIIYINGPSSSGKTTLAKALQEAFDEPFLHIGIDRIIGMMPAKINNWEGGSAPLGFSWKKRYDEAGHLMHEIQTGPFALKCVETLRELVKLLASLGHFVIVDDVSFGIDQVKEWHKALEPYSVLWVGLSTPVHLLEERERARPGRILGSARAQADKVHEGVDYDLEFDTSKMPLEQIVQAIVNLYAS